MYQQPGGMAYAPPPPKKTSPWLIALIVLGGCGVAGIAAIAVLAAILFPVFARARGAAQRALCMSHEKRISTALMVYMEDYDQTLPPKTAWESGLSGLGDDRIFTCPTRRAATEGYAYNSLLDRRPLKRVANPAQTPLVFESSLNTPNASDKLQSFVRPHVDTGNVAFVDGHVMAYKAPPHATAGLSR